LLRAGEAPQDAHHLAAATGLHVTTVRFHLQILERAGLVVSRPRRRGGSGRPRTVYAATAQRSTDTGARTYQDLAAVLATHLDDTTEGRSARAERAGMAWAAHVATARPSAATGSGFTSSEAASQVTQVCSELGFDPELSADGDGWRIRLRACPFRAVAREHPEVVCSVHLGLIRGTLDRLGGPPLASRLVPFVEPELCVAHLGAAHTA
jgi:predicted ArsR family transcriptional regulator